MYGHSLRLLLIVGNTSDHISGERRQVDSKRP